MKYLTRCSIPGCTRETTRRVQIILTKTGVTAAHRFICSDERCEAEARQSMTVRTETVNI